MSWHVPHREAKKRKRQRQLERGLCMACNEPRSKLNKLYCEEHRKKHNLLMRKRGLRISKKYNEIFRDKTKSSKQISKITKKQNLEKVNKAQREWSKKNPHKIEEYRKERYAKGLYKIMDKAGISEPTQKAIVLDGILLDKRMEELKCTAK